MKTKSFQTISQPITAFAFLLNTLWVKKESMCQPPVFVNTSWNLFKHSTLYVYLESLLSYVNKNLLSSTGSWNSNYPFLVYSDAEV